MIRMIQRRLIIPRGDTGLFSIPYLKTINAGDVAVFTIFDPRTHTKLYQKLVAAEGDILNIAFSHSDTVNLKPGKYLWDIKIYTNPQIIDDELVNGDEVDSYYAGFSLPECEIRETGDTLLTSDDAPTSTISPESLNIINAAINEVLNIKRAAVEAAETAGLKADAAAENAEDASNFAFAASQSAATAEARVNEIENLSVEVDTGLEGTDASVTYTPSTGVLSFIIPRGNTGNGIASCVLNNDFTLTINYTNGDSTTTIPIRGDTPHLTIGEITEGPHAIATITGTDANPILNLTLPNADVPTKLSQLTDDIGVAEKANSADLATVATSGSYTDLGDKPYIPVNTSELTNDAGFITSAAVPTKISDLTDDSGHYTKPETGIPASDLEEEIVSTIDSKASAICEDATGSIVSFTDGMEDMPVKRLAVNVEPMQDLHGYDSPWPAGGGNNLIYFVPYSDNDYYPISTVISPVINVEDQTITLNCGASGRTIIIYKHDFDPGQYTVTFDVTKYEKRAMVRCFDAEGNILTNNDVSDIGTWNALYQGFYFSKKTFIIPETVDHFWIGFGVAEDTCNDTVVISKVMLESGRTDGVYAPYSNICPITGWTGAKVTVSPTTDEADGSTYSIAFPTEAGTVYGGMLDVTNGVLTVDKAMVDLGTLNWRYANTFNCFYSYLTPTNDQQEAKILFKATCSSYPFVGAYNKLVDKSCAYIYNQAIAVKDSAYADSDAFKTAMSGVQLVYELATPLTYQLTPQEITTLLGTNNIWADTGDTTVGYKADTKMYIDKKFAELQALILEH